MNTSAYTASSSETWLLSRNVLSEAGLEGTVTLLGPGVETPPPDRPSPHPVVLFISEGNVTVTVGPSNHILRQDSALHLPAGKTHTVRNHTEAPAKVLTLAVPAPRRDASTLVTLR